MKTVEVILKPVGDEPHVIQYDDRDNIDQAQLIVGGPIEFVHLGGRIFVVVNENGLLVNLPYNSCGFVGNFFFVRLTNAGNFAVLSGSDKRRIFKWYEANKQVPAPQKAGFEIHTLEDFEEHTRKVREEVAKRNEAWTQL